MVHFNTRSPWKLTKSDIFCDYFASGQFPPVGVVEASKDIFLGTVESGIIDWWSWFLHLFVIPMFRKIYISMLNLCKVIAVQNVKGNVIFNRKKTRNIFMSLQITWQEYETLISSYFWPNSKLNLKSFENLTLSKSSHLEQC